MPRSPRPGKASSIGRAWCWLLVLAAAPAVAGDGAITGRVEDGTTAAGLMGAHLLVAGTRLGAVADSSGHFTIGPVPPGTYRLTATRLGYKARIVRQVVVRSGETTSLDIALRPQSIELATVTVVGQRPGPDPQQSSAHRIEALQVVEMPGGGEDLFRSLHALPGVVARADFASQFYVRGGSPDQNLIVVDRVPVFNPYRLKLLGGPVSMFNPDMVERVALLPGGFPARYGDRLAAVLVVENREGDRVNRHWSGGASLIDMRALVEGPVPGSGRNGSWIAATRRTWYDQLFNRLDSLPRGTVLPFFRDYQAKLVYDLGPEQKLHFNVLNSHEGALLKDLDVEDEDDDDFFTAADEFHFESGFDNNLYSVGWANAISDVTLSDLTLSFFNDDWFFDLTTEDELFRAGIDMRKLDIREDLTHILSRDHHLEMGLAVADLITDITVEIRQDSAAYYESEPGDRRDEDGALVERSIRLQNASTTTAFYLQDEWRRWHPRLLVLPGARLDYSTFTREWVFSPRLGLRYALTDGLLGRAGWGYYHQAPNFVGLFERFEREIEWNLFETIVLETERAQHFTAGLEWDRGQAHGARLEGYYKGLDHLVVARDSTWQSIPDNSGRGHAYGLELFLQRRPSAATRLSGWISYSLGVSKEGNPREPLHYRDVDQRHTLDLVGRLGITRRSWLDVRYSYGSGFPWTPVVRDPNGEPLHDAEGRVIREPVNSRRYPAYRRLDVRLSWRRGFGSGRTLTAYLEVINALNRRNVFEYYWDGDYRRLVSYMLPIMPFFGVRLGP